MIEGKMQGADGVIGADRAPGRAAVGRRWALVVGMVLVGWAAGVGPAAAATEALPELVADPPDGMELQSTGGQLLLRFNGYVHNAGMGALDIRASRSDTSQPMTVQQRIFQPDGNISRQVTLPGAQMIFATADGHDHWHLQNVAAYSLWNQDRTQKEAPAMKVGFCLDDSEHVDLGMGPSTAFYSDANGRQFCQAGNPGALSVFEGISSGWRDLYDRGLTFQWVDVSNVQPGVYWLREDVDPNGIFVAVASPRPFTYAATSSTIPGYDAKPLAVGPVVSGSEAPITLQADSFSPAGPVQFRVLTPPAHGTLNVQTGSSFTNPALTYSAAPGYQGPDSFTYVAQDSASSFPLQPAPATVSINVSAPPSSAPTPPAAPGPSRAQIRTLLHRGLIPHTRRPAEIRVLLKQRGYVVSVAGLVPGNAVIDWYLVPAGAHISQGKSRPVLVASGRLVFRKAGTARVKLKLTAAGRKLLERERWLRLTAKGTFTPAGRSAVSTTRGFVLRP
jgi:hypothetical protein